MTARVSRVRTVAGSSSTGRTTRVRSQTVDVLAARVAKVRSKTSGTAGAPITLTVEPYDSVNLGSGTWTQTSGPSVSVPIFNAPAMPGIVGQPPPGATLTFTSTEGGVATITVLPHTMRRATGSVWQPYRVTSL